MEHPGVQDRWREFPAGLAKNPPDDAIVSARIRYTPVHGAGKQESDIRDFRSGRSRTEQAGRILPSLRGGFVVGSGADRVAPGSGMDGIDYLIVGAGAAGSVLAERLTRSGRLRVAVLEAGPADRSPWIHLPVGYGKLFWHRQLNWQFWTDPQEALAGRKDYWPRGRVLGGSGSINAMVWCRGLPHDFDDWAAAGATGWGWDAVKPVFDRIETRIAADGSTDGNGPVPVPDSRHRIHRANRHYFDAAKELGLPVSDDVNGTAPEGAAAYRFNIRGGLRRSAGQVCLRPTMKRANLKVVTGAQVTRLLFEGRTVVGVAYRQGNETREIRAREVILSAGAVQSPQLLQLSGIGPADLLKRHGIEVRLDNSNVGGNLQDHLAVTYYYRATERTLNNDLAPLWGKAMAALKYALTRSGPLAMSVNQAGGFLRSEASLDRPDQQMYFTPLTYSTSTVGKRTIINPDPWPGFLICYQPARPTSRGRIDIRSANPLEAPSIMPNALSTDHDRARVVAGGRLTARLMRTEALGRLDAGPRGIDIRDLDDEAILWDFRERSGTVYHPVATCRMGSGPEDGVCDARLRVFGVEGLRVVDASAFPNLTSGNTNAPTMMLADRAADLILEDEGHR
jgi:choline dehydrogenase